MDAEKMARECGPCPTPEVCEAQGEDYGRDLCAAYHVLHPGAMVPTNITALKIATEFATLLTTAHNSGLERASEIAVRRSRRSARSRAIRREIK